MKPSLSRRNFLKTGVEWNAPPVRFRRVGHRQELLQRFGLEGLCRLRIRRDELVRGLRDVPAPAIVGGNSEGESRILRGKRLAGRDQLADSRLEA